MREHRDNTGQMHTDNYAVGKALRSAPADLRIPSSGSVKGGRDATHEYSRATARHGRSWQKLQSVLTFLER
jgi:hypothetical protein